jgi:hypothetical protein
VDDAKREKKWVLVPLENGGRYLGQLKSVWD